MERLLLRPTRKLGRLRPVPPSVSSWTCVSCRHHALGRSFDARGYSTESATSSPSVPRSPLTEADDTSAKPYYVTTPIFYVNAAPHIGHLYSMVVADALKRWQILAGRKALLLTGTDEHGMKVQRAAESKETPPKTWCDLQSAKFRNLAEKANISYDFFIRTTDEDHKNAVRHFWYLLKQSGYIYEAKHEGWYCVSDETFYTESQLSRQQDPITGRVYMASLETGNEVEWMEEKTYHFRLTALKDQLLAFYTNNPTWIQPESRMREVVNWVTNKLEDLSISRPTSRLAWGIRVPDDDSQTIYVWVDALVNYLTKAGFPDWTPGKEKEGGWPADLHVIGKDILRFHGIYWPALLMAVGIPPPKALLSHAHWTMNGKKMSKSLGNVVNPTQAIDRWGVDTLRYFMLADGGIQHDADYDNLMIKSRYETFLSPGIGNLLSRITRSPKWNVRESVFIGCPKVEAMKEEDLKTLGVMSRKPTLIQAKMDIDLVYKRMNEAMNSGLSRKALHNFRDFVKNANIVMTLHAPWDQVSELDKEKGLRKIQAKRYRLCMSIFDTAERIRTIGILLQPFMPEKAKHLLDVLGVDESKRTFAYIGLGKDSTYGIPKRPPGKGSHDALFPRLEVEEFDANKVVRRFAK